MSSFSVIVPCYNYAHYLKACVNSILSQGVDVQVLIIDDCSNDDTPAVGASLAQDPRVTFLRHEINQGHINTYNEGLALATGDYTALISSDDLLTPGALRRAQTVLDAHPEVGMVYGRSIYFQSNDNLPKARTGEPRVDIWKGRDWIAERCKTATSCISSPEVVVRTSVQRQLGGYRTDLPHAGDLEMWLRFAAHRSVVYLGGVDQAYYRKHVASMHVTKFNSPLADLAQRKAAFDVVLDSHGARIGDPGELRQMAHRALAREALQNACWGYDRGRLDAVSVEDLAAFAQSIYPDVRSLTEYHELRLRRSVGPRWSHVLQHILPGRYIRWTKSWLWWRRWRTRGV